MSIGLTTTRLASSRPRSLNGANIGGVVAEAGDEVRVAHPQLAVRDPAAAGQQVERERARVLLGVAADPLEPLERALRRALRALDDRAALGLVGVDVVLP